MHWLVTQKNVKVIVLEMQQKRFLFMRGSPVLTGNVLSFEEELDQPDTW